MIDFQQKYDGACDQRDGIRALLDAVVEKTHEIASNPPQAVMFVKELFRQNPLDPDIDQVGERENIRDQIARRHPDHAEALAGFMEKRAEVR